MSKLKELLDEMEGEASEAPPDKGYDCLTEFLFLAILLIIAALALYAIFGDATANSCFSSSYRSTHHHICKKAFD